MLALTIIPPPSLDKTKVSITKLLRNYLIIDNKIIENFKIKPVPIQKSFVLINNFVTNTIEFFNSFSESVEKRISHISNKITEVEILLAVLEAKLNSVPDFEPTPQLSTSSADKSETAKSVDINTNEPTAIPSLPTFESSSSKVKVSEHPEYIQFFKLMKLGVPLPVIQAKVLAANLNPAMLDQPNLLVDL
jgi:WASH complex subunit CCDC53